MADDEAVVIDPALLPKKGVKYPLVVDYCHNCSMPFEYCEYYPDYEGCKKWLEEKMPEKFSQLGLDVEATGSAADDAKKPQKRGGKGMMKAKKKEVTVVQGLKTFGIDLKVASKFFGQKFACGASITGDDEIVIQGDFKDDLYDLIPEKWSEVDEDLIEDLGSKKRT